MKRTSQSLHGQFSPRCASLYLMLAALMAVPLAHGQSNAPVTGTMMQISPEQRARIEEAARQAQAEERARRAAAARQQAAQQQASGTAPGQASAPAAPRPASSVVRQVPGPATASSAPAQAAASAQPAASSSSAVGQRSQPVQSPDMRVTTVVTPPASGAAASQPAAVATAATSAPASPAVAPASATQEASSGKSRPAGEVTRAILRAQAEGRLAGQALPMLGATAAPSWKRYVESFSRPIPEFYETTSQPKQ